MNSEFREGFEKQALNLRSLKAGATKLKEIVKDYYKNPTYRELLERKLKKKKKAAKKQLSLVMDKIR